MSHNWLNVSLLLSDYWYYTVKCAVKVSNYLSIRLHGQITTSFEIVHHTKPDIPSIFPVCIAYIGKQTDDTIARTPQGQSIHVIVIRKSSKSNCIEFYHPPSKQVIPSSVYRLYPILASGPVFSLKYDGGLFFNTYHNKINAHQPPTFQLDSIVYTQTKATDTALAKSISISLQDSGTYALQ